MKLETADAPELVVVVADADAEMLLNALLQRGIERQCLRPFPWKILRDPMRDAAVRREPEKTLRAMHFVRPPKVVIAFDHEGSGIEETKPVVIESEVQMRLTSLGYHREDVCCIVFAPELEVALVPVWSRCLELLAKRRNRPCPSMPELLKRGQLSPRVDKSPETQWLQYLQRDPKEGLQAALHLLNLRHEPSLFEDFGKQLSLDGLKKGQCLGKLAQFLATWFGTRTTHNNCR